MRHTNPPPDGERERPRRVPPLKSVLPAGYEAAQADLDKIFELAEGEMKPDDPNLAWMPGLRRWLNTQLAAEYSVRGTEPEDDPVPGGD